MVTFTPHYLIQFGGTIGNAAQEQWSCGIRCHSGDYTGFDEDDWFANTVVGALSAWMARANSKISNQAKLVFAKCNFIDEAGHYADPGATREWIYPTPVAGASASFTLPWQASLCLSWRSDAASRGLASKGRIYQPLPAVTVTPTTGLFPTSDAQVIADSASLLLNTLDTSFGVGQTIRPHIMSGVDGSFNEINTVLVDNKIDIQRRRAQSLVAVTMSSTVAY